MTEQFTMGNAPYLINTENGNHFPNTEGFAQVKGMRPITYDEAMDRGLPLPDEVTTTINSSIEFPDNINTIAKLNHFAVSNGLVTSLNPAKGFETLEHEVKVLVAKRNREVVDATTYVPDLPTGFYSKTVAELQKLCKEEGLDIDFKGKKKSDLQEEIISLFADRDFERQNMASEEGSVVLQEIKNNEA